MELESTKEPSPSSQTTGCGEDFLAEVQTVALPEEGYRDTRLSQSCLLVLGGILSWAAREVP